MNERNNAYFLTLNERERENERRWLWWRKNAMFVRVKDWIDFPFQSICVRKFIYSHFSFHVSQLNSHYMLEAERKWGTKRQQPLCVIE